MNEDDPRCLYDYDDVINPIFVTLVPGSQFVTSLLSIVLIIYFCIRFFRKSIFHINAKILFFWQLSLYLILSCDFVYVNGEHVFNYIFNRGNPCAFFKLARECAFDFYVYVAMVAGSAIIQVSMSIERIVSTVFAKKYDEFNGVLGLSLSVTATIAVIPISIIALSTYDPEEVRMGCYGIPISTGTRCLALYITVLVCDFVSLVLFLIAWKISSKRGIDAGAYELEQNYQRVENGRLLKMFLPNVILQSICYAVYVFATLQGRAMYDPLGNTLWNNIFIRHNALPYCIFLELIYSHVILKRLNDSRKRFQAKISGTSVKTPPGDAYFKNLAQQWG